MKFSTPVGVTTVKDNQELARKYYLNVLRKDAPRVSITYTLMMGYTSIPETKVEGCIHMDDTLDPHILALNFKAAVVLELEEFSVSRRDESKMLRRGCRFDPEMKDSLKKFLMENLDVFA
ncbi:Uncharacterized protein Adt_41903 [Abeliophyllum distichum]|uniref:Uncharacterized protein n=1 Tax=Abeliophyllum distichum TaxID=126358 RepID=A0ABD1PQ73_9LAMI